jgi:putative hydrolase of the HAD superfamily
MALRGLIFDFDGLIVDTETAITLAWEEVHAEHGRAADRAVLHAVVGHEGVTVDLWQAFPPEHDRAWLEARMQRLARAKCEAAPVLPGVVELIEAAKVAGLRLAVASNSSHRHVDGHLKARGLWAHFDAVVCRDDVARGKPAPDPYLLALERLGLAAEDVVAFEDSVPGHEAAAAAGLRVVAVPNPVTWRDEFPQAVLRAGSLAELSLERLERLAAKKPAGEVRRAGELAER